MARYILSIRFVEQGALACPCHPGYGDIWSSVEQMDVFPKAFYENVQGVCVTKCKTQRQHVRRLANPRGVGVHLVVSP
jgi:hypothetical protein